MNPVLSPYVWQPAQDNRIPTDIGGSPPSVPGSSLPASALVPPGSGSQAAYETPPPVPTYNPGNYGEAVTIPVVFAAAGALLALPRPSHGIRKLLIIENNIAGFVITVGFDNPPPVGGGLAIAAAGNLLLDNAVPQNDIWIFSPAAGTVQIVYMIDNISGA